MATHSSVLAWRIPGMGEAGGLPSMGLHRVGHDRSDLAAAAVWSNTSLLADTFPSSPWLSLKGTLDNARKHIDCLWITASKVRCGEGHSSPLQHSCLENPMDRGAWRAMVHGVAKIWIRLKQLGRAQQGKMSVWSPCRYGHTCPQVHPSL